MPRWGDVDDEGRKEESDEDRGGGNERGRKTFARFINFTRGREGERVDKGTF